MLSEYRGTNAQMAALPFVKTGASILGVGGSRPPDFGLGDVGSRRGLWGRGRS